MFLFCDFSRIEISIFFLLLIYLWCLGRSTREVFPLNIKTQNEQKKITATNSLRTKIPNNIEKGTTTSPITEIDSE